LAAEAAYRSGAGLVTLAVGETIYPIIAAGHWSRRFLILPDIWAQSFLMRSVYWKST
jgi:hypothetical protein